MSFREKKEKPKTWRDFGFFIGILGQWLISCPITKADNGDIKIKYCQLVVAEQLESKNVTTNFSKNAKCVGCTSGVA